MVDKVKLDIIILNKNKHLIEEKMKIKYSNVFIQSMAFGDPKTYVYQFILMKMTVMTQISYNIYYA